MTEEAFALLNEVEAPAQPSSPAQQQAASPNPLYFESSAKM
jgi:hypothetical protein